MVYEMLKSFKKKYPMTICFRLRKHANVVEKHLNPGEYVNYAFAAQTPALISTYVVILTNKRILLAQKKVLFGYTFLAITPDMFNDLTVNSGVIWCNINIDTVKETVVLTYVDKKAASEIETKITEYMMEEKKKYTINNEKN